ncbi:anti-sigma factor [Streptomyces sp. H27-D2]|uniref:anti-sigma factor n=1 Tax=Streptomyces sp. H27-D2 TaxID=3046304 RepID=UPI002DBFCB5F|nr:anti-sigma factor [Streptomyces sp. H27-D2]MEC4018722.1 anti-sigma factor [Streptomyces sp. H27-D2]
MTIADLHTLTGAYAVHGLPPGEREEFERHLSACEPCEREVAELRATAERLGLAVSVVPPPEMRDAVLRRVATVRQEPPKVAREGRAGGPRSHRMRRLPRFVLAACLAGAVALGGVAVWQHQEAQDARDQAQRAEQQADSLARVLAAPDARTATAAIGNGASGTVVVSRSQNKAAFLASGMPSLPGDKVYQLWFNDGGKMRSAGLMNAAAGDKAVVLSGAVDASSGMGVTVEPAGGSTQPTSDPLALMDFPA